jgi:hypothetical protein
VLRARLTKCDALCSRLKRCRSSAKMMKSIQLGALFAGTIFIAGCATDPEILPPPCSTPAVFAGNYHQSTPGYLVSVQDSVADIESLVHELAAKHAFKPESIMSTVRIFSVEELTPGALAALLCEPTIAAISFNEPTRIGYAL